jgi:hypothetical protein
MKKLLRPLIAGLLLLTASCSDENIEPRPLTDDLKTSANGHWDEYFSIYVVTHWDDDFSLFLIGTGGNLTVDWGDGSSESFYVGEEYVSVEHDFNRAEEDPGEFAITISGDLHSIKGVDYFYDGIDVREMHFGGLINLTNLNMGIIQSGPPVINLSENSMIERIILPGVQRMEELILPSVNKIRAIDISGTNSLNTADVDRIIARVHDSVVKSPRSGFFSLPVSWAQEENDQSLLGPPSRHSYNKLRKLQKKYGWSIYPGVK